MLLSKYFLPIVKENPIEAKVTSHKLMIKSGMIKQMHSGIYSWLPLGLKVMNRVINIINLELEKIGCIPLLMPTIQSSDIWIESERYDSYGKEMLRIKDRHGRNMLYGPTHEEVVTDIFRKTIFSYKDLPKNLYHIQWKFRDEIRPRFGVMRGREFLMKDGYSFDVDFKSAQKSYFNMYKVYLDIFKKMNLVPIAVEADNGVIGGNLSHEFHILADTGESNIYYDRKIDDIIKSNEIDLEELQSLYAVNEEKYTDKCKNLKSRRGIEVGHIFYFDDKYTKKLHATVSDKNGKEIFPKMGSYGIGITRLIAAIIEVHSDEKGIIWPSIISPFDVALVNLSSSNQECNAVCDKIYHKLNQLKLEPIYDDRSHISMNQKFQDIDLIGIPYQIIIGSKSLKEKIVEIKNRKTSKTDKVSINEIEKWIHNNITKN